MSFLFSTLFGALLVIGALLLRKRFISFHSQSPEDYEGLGPEFDLRRHLEGPILCEGVIYGPTGRVTSRFVADMQGSWEGNRGVLSERFLYDNGDTQDRAWHIELGRSGTIRATADDVIGTGKGRQAGPTVQLRYRIRLPEEAGGHVLDTVDWMYMIPGGTIINRSQFRMFGFKVAELVATMRPKDRT